MIMIRVPGYTISPSASGPLPSAQSKGGYRECSLTA
jgi:hypothetical protein